MNNDDFTVPVSGGSRRHWVSVYTVWPSHSKLLSKYSKFELSLKILCRNYSDGWESCSYGHLVIGSFIMTMCLITHHVSCRLFGETSNHPGDSASLQPRFGAWWLLAIPKLKSPLKGKRFQTISEIQENMMGQLIAIGRAAWGAYFERDWGVIVLCAMFLVSCVSFSKCLFFIVHGWTFSGQTLHVSFSVWVKAWVTEDIVFLF